MADFEKQKCREDFLLKEIERRDQLAESEEDPSFEEDSRVALKGRIISNISSR